MLTVHTCCDSDLFMHLINHAASSILFHKYVSYESYLLFQNVQNLISSSELQKKIQKILLVFKIISLNSLRWTVTFTEREYLSSGCNMLANIPKISDTTKTKFFHLKFFQSAQKNGKTTAVQISECWETWQNYGRADFITVSHPLTCWLSIGVVTRRISVATLFAEYNFVNTSGFRLNFAFEMFKIWCRLHKCRKKFKSYFRFTV